MWSVIRKRVNIWLCLKQNNRYMKTINDVIQWFIPYLDSDAITIS